MHLFGESVAVLATALWLLPGDKAVDLRLSISNCVLRDQRRRPSTEVVNSLGCFAIGLFLVFAVAIRMFASRRTLIVGGVSLFFSATWLLRQLLETDPNRRIKPVGDEFGGRVKVGIQAKVYDSYNGRAPSPSKRRAKNRRKLSIFGYFDYKNDNCCCVATWVAIAEAKVNHLLIFRVTGNNGFSIHCFIRGAPSLVQIEYGWRVGCLRVYEHGRAGCRSI